MKYSIYLVLLLFTVGILSCRKQTIQPPPTDLGWDFQPLNKGHFVVYDVDSIIYDDFNKTIDTFRSEIKDEIGDKFQDDQGRDSYYITRYGRKDASFPWQVVHIFYITQDNFKLEWKENNLRFIKMVYPTKLNKKWKGNKYMPTQTNSDLGWLDDWDYRYSDVLATFNTGSKSYKNAHIIDQADYIEGDPTNVNAFSAQTYSREVFAKNVGMIYRKVTRWEYQPSGAKFRSGFTAIFKAKSNN